MATAYTRIATLAHDDSGTEVYEYAKVVDGQPVRWLVEIEGPLMQDVRGFDTESDADRFVRGITGSSRRGWVSA